MKLLTQLLLITAALAAAAEASTLPVVTFELSPIHGFVQGAAGSSVGWGFTLSTDSGFVTIESFLFQESSPVGIFTAFVPNLAASAGSPIIAAWVPNIAGLQYDIDSGAILNSATQGPMTVIYDAYSDAALTDQTVFGEFLDATDNAGAVNAGVSVNGDAAAEPTTALLLAGGMAILLSIRHRRREKRLTREPLSMAPRGL